jgi:BirA family biotin operon repressor/biotin-[acetyl-CoA-carboxylase] ligase
VKGSVIWVESVDSTNEEMKRRLKQQYSLKNFDAIVANFQTNGKGQREAKWESQSGENLTFSLYFQPNNLKVLDAFKLNQAVSILISDFLKGLGLKNVQVKWPNDIMVNEKKICGVLTENILSKDELIESIIGIGLNVNQSRILSNSNSTSISNEMHEYYLIRIIAEELIGYLEKVQDFINRPLLLQNRYLELLLGLNETRKFAIDDRQVEGKIVGINSTGKLRVLIDQEEQLFEQKQIRFLFE